MAFREEVGVSRKGRRKRKKRKKKRKKEEESHGRVKLSKLVPWVLENKMQKSRTDRMGLQETAE